MKKVEGIIQRDQKMPLIEETSDLMGQSNSD